MTAATATVARRGVATRRWRAAGRAAAVWRRRAAATTARRIGSRPSTASAPQRAGESARQGACQGIADESGVRGRQVTEIRLALRLYVGPSPLERQL
eukprot:scaffold128470_cov40-Phaeocystis_antarctica.AAC.1